MVHRSIFAFSLNLKKKKTFGKLLISSNTFIGIVLYYKIIVGINFRATMVSIWCKTFSHLMIFVVEKSKVGVKMFGTKNEANHSDSFKCAFAL